MTSEIKCHVCGGKCEEFASFSRLRQVTSDCKPYQNGGQLTICQSCDLVQRPITSVWQSSIKEIYSNYHLFAQGIEQLEETIFLSKTGDNLSRSYRMISWLETNTKLPDHGSLLDIGCGKGGFLSSFSSYRPEWNLTGLDLACDVKSSIEKIPNTHFVNGDLPDLDKNIRYDLIVLSHTLEHIPNPIDFLKKVNELLEEDGILFIEIPNLETAPFDILVADHCSFFTTKTLSYLLQKSDFDILKIAVDVLPKEISLISRKKLSNNDRGSHDLTSHFADTKQVVIKNINFLNSMKDRFFAESQAVEKFGIFGSSISSSWLLGEIGEAKFFVDENPYRIGSKHLGLPILDVSDIEGTDTVLMPLSYDIAEQIANRIYNKTGLLDVFVLPPTQNN